MTSALAAQTCRSAALTVTTINSLSATADNFIRGWTRIYRNDDIFHLQLDVLIFHSHMTGNSQIKTRGLRIDLSDIKSIDRYFHI